MSTVKSGPPEIVGLTFSGPIGGGGFADVFLYVQHSTKRPVAVKVLRAEHLRQDTLDQFEVEADVMARVSAHPYIVTVLDAGVATDGRPFIVMEYYPRPHFGLRARGGGLRVPEVLRVGVQVASAVETAHRADIVHRDIKPANILTSDYENPGLTDFGLAGVQDERGLSIAGGVSPGFAAPEILVDDRATGSRSSDVYALGATLYALLAGRSPIWHPGGENSEGQLVHRAATAQVLPTGRDDVPPMLEHALHLCLEPDPTHRPPGAAEFARMLQDVEQSLSLTPTQLALAGAGEVPATSRGAEDEERTRRRAKVVDPSTPSETGSVTRPRGSAPAVPPTASDVQVAPVAPVASVASVASTATYDVAADIDRAHTIHRTPASTTVDPDAAAPSGRPRWALPAALLGLVAVIAIIAVITGTGGGADQAAATTTTLLRSDPDNPVISSLDDTDVPLDPVARVEDDGSITITWKPPAGPLREEVVYDVMDAAGLLIPDGKGVTVTDFRVRAPSGEGPWCFQIAAAIHEAVSDSVEACTDDAEASP
ncbi:MAG: protein kinase [Actinobacteria bacterium]|nr:protein kinase [Actinomycetota bacterium]